MPLTSAALSPTEIDNSAFGICSALTDVYYVGTKEQWDAVGIVVDTGLDAPEIHFGG